MTALHSAATIMARRVPRGLFAGLLQS